MITVRLKAGAIKRRMAAMSLLPAIIAAYGMTAAYGPASIKSPAIFILASLGILGMVLFFEYVCWFKLQHPIVFCMEKDGVGFYRPTFNKFEFRATHPFKVMVLKDGVSISPEIQGLPFFAKRDGMTFIETNSSYAICESGITDQQR